MEKEDLSAENEWLERLLARAKSLVPSLGGSAAAAETCETEMQPPGHFFPAEDKAAAAEETRPAASSAAAESAIAPGQQVPDEHAVDSLAIGAGVDGAPSFLSYADLLRAGTAASSASRLAAALGVRAGAAPPMLGMRFPQEQQPQQQSLLLAPSAAMDLSLGVPAGLAAAAAHVNPLVAQQPQVYLPIMLLQLAVQSAAAPPAAQQSLFFMPSDFGELQPTTAALEEQSLMLPLPAFTQQHDDR